MKTTKAKKREMRHNRIRAIVTGTAARPRLVVFRSLKRNYAQLIDDTVGKSLLAASDTAFLKEGTKCERAKKVGLEIAKLAAKQGITTCCFDRNGYRYHGRVKALADGAREGGLKF
jgi:large subunit ribosomal protein L18